MRTTSSTSQFLNLPLLALVLCLVVFFVSCDTADVTQPTPDDTGTTDPGPNPDGVLLDGDPTDTALDAIVLLPPSPVATADIEGNLMLTRLTAYVNPAATVAEVNDALTANNVRIVTMWSGLPAMTLKIPRVSDLAAAETVADTLQATNAFQLVTPTWEVQADPVESGPVPQPLGVTGPTTLSEHLLLQQFTVSWHGVEAARLKNNKVPVLVPDAYFSRVPHPLIPSQVFVGSGRTITQSFAGKYIGNHGFHVSGIIGAKETFDVAGIHPDTSLIRILSHPILGYSMVDMMYALVLEFPPTGQFVLNTSFGYADQDFSDNSKARRASETALWRTLTFEASTRFFHATAAGNAGQTQGDGGESRYTSPFNISRNYADLRVLAAEDEFAFQDEQQNFENLMSLLPHVDFLPDNVMTVGSSTNGGQRSLFSNRSADVRVIAENVRSACVKQDPDCNGSYGMQTGTSMAAPQVAGLAAYLMSLDPTLTPTQVRDRIQRGFDENPGGVFKAYSVVLGTDASITSAPFRKAVFDVTDATLDFDEPDGVFDENDIELYLSQLEFYSNELDQDYSRYDLNGNGITRLADQGRFDLDVNNPPAWTTVSLTIEGETVTFDENDVSDLDILCYYAFSSLYQGSAAARLELLREACGIGTAGEIIVSTRASSASASAAVCDNLPIKETTAGFEPFTADLANSFGCADGTATGTIQYADTFRTNGRSLTSVSASGSATASATHLDTENPFISTAGSGQGTMQLFFEVVDKPAQFVFDGNGTAAATGPATAAEVSVQLHSPTSPDFLWRVFVSDSTAAPIVWHEAGELPPGFYAISIAVRASGAPDFRTANILNSASASLSCVLTFSQ